MRPCGRDVVHERIIMPKWERDLMGPTRGDTSLREAFRQLVGARPLAGRWLAAQMAAWVRFFARILRRIALT